MDKQPEEIAGMFDGVARRYDFINNLLSGGSAPLWRLATVRAIDPQSGEHILDVAAGTGTSSAAVARNGASVTGVDIAAGMLDEARKRYPGVDFVLANAESLPFASDTFDAVTISFGIRNVTHPKVALDEFYRVLKPGGRLVICEFSRPPRALVRAGYLGYLKYVMPAVAGLASSNPEAYSYLEESIKAWPDQGTLSQWIRASGFTRVAYRNLTGGIVALHRGRKPADAAVLASVAKRKTAYTKPIAIQKPAGTKKPAATQKPVVADKPERAQ
jgi:demethylmenaquinone methyltransferase / 2-methoxy-6-polyprenyl-1,4-benzoquinol methylase